MLCFPVLMKLFVVCICQAKEMKLRHINYFFDKHPLKIFSYLVKTSLELIKTVSRT